MGSSGFVGGIGSIGVIGRVSVFLRSKKKAAIMVITIRKTPIQRPRTPKVLTQPGETL
jgi:hypothetical protein